MNNNTNPVEIESDSIASMLCEIVSVPTDRAYTLGAALTDALTEAEPETGEDFKKVFQTMETDHITSAAEREYVLCMLGFMIGAHTIAEKILG